MNAHSTCSIVFRWSSLPYFVAAYPPPCVCLGSCALQVAAPLHHPDTFPRPIKVYVSTLAAEKPGPVGGDRAVYEPAIYRDVDPDTGRATIIAIGTPSIAQLQSVITSAASQLMLTGGYRGKIGGGKRVQMAFAYQQECKLGGASLVCACTG